MSLQTLHPLSFDEGIILDQTPLPGIDVPEDCDYLGLLKIMQPLGAEMLLNAIRQRLYLPPYRGVGQIKETAEGERVYKHAPKIETADRLLRFDTMDSSHILKMSRAFESTWAYSTVLTRTSEYKSQRILFQEPFRTFSSSSAYMEERQCIPQIPPGLPYWPQSATEDAKEPSNPCLLVNTIDGRTLLAASMKVEGGVKMPAYQAALKHRLIPQERHTNPKSVITFHRALTAQPEAGLLIRPLSVS